MPRWSWLICTGLLIASPRPVLVQAASVRPDAAPANAGARAGDGAGTLSVTLPFILQDQAGVSWDFQNDGSVGDGGNDLYDGGGALFCDDTHYEGSGQARFDRPTNTLSFPAQSIRGLAVRRLITVNAKGPWCRFVEVFENSANQPVKAAVRVHFDLGGQIQSLQQVTSAKGRLLGVVVSDGTRQIAMLTGGASARVVPSVASEIGSDICDVLIEVTVPPRKTVAVAHYQSIRSTFADAANFISGKTTDLLQDLPVDIRKAVINFGSSGNGLFDQIELPHGDGVDTVQLRGGDVCVGTLVDPAFKLSTDFGNFSIDTANVLGLVSVGVRQPRQLLLLRDGQIVGGQLAGDAVRLRLGSRQLVSIPFDTVSLVGARKQAGDAKEIKLDRPYMWLAGGDRIFIDPGPQPLQVATTYGSLSLAPSALARIDFTGDDQPVHLVRLRDGSRFAGVVSGGSIDVHPVGLAAFATGGSAIAATSQPTSQAAAAPPPAAAPPVAPTNAVLAVPTSLLRCVSFANVPDDADPDLPAWQLKSGDRLVGVLSKPLELRTRFDVLRVNAQEIRDIRPLKTDASEPALFSELAVTLWDGAVVSGTIGSTTLPVRLQDDLELAVPLAALVAYTNPEPLPPAEVLERTRVIVKTLSDPEWKKRLAAADELRSLGVGAIGLLRQLKKGEPPEAQTQIDGILQELEKRKEAQSHSAAAPAPPPSGLIELNKDVMPLPLDPPPQN